jgi:hypothetical protein
VRTDNLTNIQSILSQPTSNLSFQEYNALLLRFCVQHKLSHVLFSCLANVDGLSELVNTANIPESATIWLQSWLHLVQLSDDPENNILKAVESSLHLLAGDNISNYLEERPLLIMALILLNSQSPSDVLSGVQTHEFLTPDLIESLKKSMPVLEQVLSTESWSDRNKPDITLYELLEKATPFDVTKLFGWQEAHK